MRSLRALVACSALALFGFRDPGCGASGGSERVGLNGPCTRPRDCEVALKCQEGVCVPEDAGTPKDAGFDVIFAFDAPADGPAADGADAGGDGATEASADAGGD